MKKKGLSELVEVLLQEVAEFKNIDKDVVLDSLKDALSSAARRYLQLQNRVDVDIDVETGEVSVFLRVEVVDDYPEYDLDMSAEEVAELDEGYMLVQNAQRFNENAQHGDFLEMEIPIANFGRQAIQTAKQFLIQRVKEAERAQIYESYKNKVGMLITGTVMRTEKRAHYVSIGPNVEGVLLESGQIRKEKLKRGSPVKAIIESVNEASRAGSQIVLSRTCGKFLEELFRQEVPEIAEGTVEIKGTARDPGFRAKIAVLSRDSRIDPVGACVGMRGMRVQSIVRELSNERIDIVHWSEELPTYIRRALSPANVSRIFDVEGVQRSVVVVSDADLAQTIGRNGQNVRLASNLLGRTIDVFGESDWAEKTEEEKQIIIQPRSEDLRKEQKEAGKSLKELFDEENTSTSKTDELDGIEAMVQAGEDAAVEQDLEDADEMVPLDRENLEN